MFDIQDVLSTLPSGDTGSQRAHMQKRQFDECSKRRTRKTLLSKLAQGAEAGTASERV